MKRTTLLVISFLLFIAILAAYSLQYKETKISLIHSDSPYMDEITIKHRKDGFLKWSVEAKNAVFSNTNEVILRDLKISFPERELILTSDTGSYNPTNQSIKVEGNIKALTKNFSINASSLAWDPKASELSSDKKIQIVGNDFYIEGDELTASADKARLNSNVKAVFK